MLSKETDLDHPCKETCSGWKQGYDRGVAETLKETVTITKKEYESLKDSELLLRCLEIAGVDCWDGYDEAVEQYRELLKK